MLLTPEIYDEERGTNLIHPCELAEIAYESALSNMAKICHAFSKYRRYTENDFTGEGIEGVVTERLKKQLQRDALEAISAAESDALADWNAYCDLLMDHEVRVSWNPDTTLGEILARTVPYPLGVRMAVLPSGARMAIHPVTQGQYQALMGKNPAYFSPTGGGKGKLGLGGSESLMDSSLFPVEMVSWYDARNFCRTYNKWFPDYSVRLLTEKEWEEGCRAGTTTPFAFGETLSSYQANFDGNHPTSGAPKGPYLQRTCRVGSYLPNAWGLYDTHGNVWEWCALAKDVEKNAFGVPARTLSAEGTGGTSTPTRYLRTSIQTSEAKSLDSESQQSEEVEGNVQRRGDPMRQAQPSAIVSGTTSLQGTASTGEDSDLPEGSKKRPFAPAADVAGTHGNLPSSLGLVSPAMETKSADSDSEDEHRCPLPTALPTTATLWREQIPAQLVGASPGNPLEASNTQGAASESEGSEEVPFVEGSSVGAEAGKQRLSVPPTVNALRPNPTGSQDSESEVSTATRPLAENAGLPPLSAMKVASVQESPTPSEASDLEEGSPYRPFSSVATPPQQIGVPPPILNTTAPSAEPTSESMGSLPLSEPEADSESEDSRYRPFVGDLGSLSAHLAISKRAGLSPVFITSDSGLGDSGRQFYYKGQPWNWQQAPYRLLPYVGGLSLLSRGEFTRGFRIGT